MISAAHCSAACPAQVWQNAHYGHFMVTRHLDTWHCASDEETTVTNDLWCLLTGRGKMTAAKKCCRTWPPGSNKLYVVTRYMRPSTGHWCDPWFPGWLWQCCGHKFLLVLTARTSQSSQPEFPCVHVYTRCTDGTSWHQAPTLHIILHLWKHSRVLKCATLETTLMTGHDTELRHHAV